MLNLPLSNYYTIKLIRPEIVNDQLGLKIFPKPDTLLRDLLKKYEFPGDKIPIVRVSALNAMNCGCGKDECKSCGPILELMKQVDSYIALPKRDIDAVERETSLLLRKIAKDIGVAAQPVLVVLLFDEDGKLEGWEN